MCTILEDVAMDVAFLFHQKQNSCLGLCAESGGLGCVYSEDFFPGLEDKSSFAFGSFPPCFYMKIHLY